MAGEFEDAHARRARKNCHACMRIARMNTACVSPHANAKHAGCDRRRPGANLRLMVYLKRPVGLLCWMVDPPGLGQGLQRRDTGGR